MNQVHNKKEAAGSPLGFLPPKQNRSKKRLDQILEATSELLQETPFEALPISEIARTAGVPIGTIYSRFSGKDQLLLYLFQEVVLSDMSHTISEVLEPQRDAGEPIEAFLQRYVCAVAEVFSEHRAILRPVTLAGRQTSGGELARTLEALNRPIHDRLRAALLERRSEISRPDPEAAVSMALHLVGAALRERFLYDDRLSRSRLGDEAFLIELGAAVAGYLRAHVV